MDSQDGKLPAPPYVPYKTFRNFLERFKQGVPGRVDRGVMNGMSGAVQSQVKTALRYLDLISEHDIPSERMKQLCRAEGDDRKKLLQEVVKEAYPYVFQDSHIDFATATGSQLREQIEKKTTASGETVGRCLAFLKDAALDAGMQVSPYVKSKTARAVNGRKPSQSRQKQQANHEPQKPNHSLADSHGSFDNHGLHDPPAKASLLLWGLFQRLPKPGSLWAQFERDRWMETLNNVLSLEYKQE